MQRMTRVGTPALFGAPGMDDNGDEGLTFEEMLEELAERGTSAITGQPAVTPTTTAKGMTLGPGVSIPAGGESIEATAQRFFGAARQAGVVPGGGGVFGVLPSWWPYAAVGLGAVGLWWWTTKRGK